MSFDDDFRMHEDIDILMLLQQIISVTIFATQ